MATRPEAAAGSGVARRLLDESGEDCPEQGYLLIPVALQALGGDDAVAAEQLFAEATGVGERFRDVNLTVLGRLGQGQARIYQGDTAGGMSLFDEVMVTVTSMNVFPPIAGVVYCAVIEACQALFDFKRAQEWTAALTRWCDDQEDVIAFRGQCLAYRSELLRLHGSWPAALQEAQRAQAVLSQPPPHPATGISLYNQAEIHRLRGEFGRAEQAYREASRWGRPPEPGLSLLRLAQGRADSAATSIRRALEEARDRPSRSRLLPAFVEIAIAVGDLGGARRATGELRAIAASVDASLVHAFADSAEGAVLLAEGDAPGALSPMRRACTALQELALPYEAARARVLIGRTYRELGDGDAAELEFDAARWAFSELGATTELAATEALIKQHLATSPGGLTARELEVLRLVAQGKTNRLIADDLVISERTVARHVSNILAKLDAPSRASATAFAYEHGLV